MNMMKGLTTLLGFNNITGKYLRDPDLEPSSSSQRRYSSTIDESSKTAPTDKFPAVAKITPTQVTSVINVLNSGRAKTTVPAANMREVSWNVNLSDALYTYFTNNDANWMFEHCDSTSPFAPNGGLCLFYLMQQEPFKSQFPGFNLLVHDTEVNPDRLVPLFEMRMDQQKHCFNYNSCNANTFDNFSSCGSPYVPTPNQPCSWSTHFYPRETMASLSEIACVAFKVHGPSAPAAQGWSFACYANYTPPLTDQPYEAGAHCSACPPDAPVCEKNLCVPKTGLRM